MKRKSLNTAFLAQIVFQGETAMTVKENNLEQENSIYYMWEG